MTLKIDTQYVVIGMDPSVSHFAILMGTLNDYYDTLLDCQFIEVQTSIPEVPMTKPRSGGRGKPKVQKCVMDFHRYQGLVSGISEAITMMPENPYAIYSEIPTGSQSYEASKGNTASIMAMAFLQTFWKNVNIQLTTPTPVKKWATGNPKATKKEMVEAMYSRFPDLPWNLNKQGLPTMNNEHCADATAILIRGLEKDGIQIKKALSDHSGPKRIVCPRRVLGIDSKL